MRVKKCIWIAQPAGGGIPKIREHLEILDFLIFLYFVTVLGVFLGQDGLRNDPDAYAFHLS